MPPPAAPVAVVPGASPKDSPTANPHGGGRSGPPRSFGDRGWPSILGRSPDWGRWPRWGRPGRTGRSRHTPHCSGLFRRKAAPPPRPPCMRNRWPPPTGSPRRPGRSRRRARIYWGPGSGTPKRYPWARRAWWLQSAPYPPPTGGPGSAAGRRDPSRRWCTACRDRRAIAPRSSCASGGSPRYGSAPACPPAVRWSRRGPVPCPLSPPCRGGRRRRCSVRMVAECGQIDIRLADDLQ